MPKFHKVIQLKDYQIKDVEFVEQNKFVLIADEMGLGKTFAAIKHILQVSETVNTLFDTS